MTDYKTAGIFVCLGGYALTGGAPTGMTAQRPATSLQSNVVVGSAAAVWRAKRLLAEAQMDWKDAQNFTADAPQPDLQEWEIAQFLDGASTVAPESACAVQGVITHVGQGEPHRASMDEMDYQLFDVIKGDL